MKSVYTLEELDNIILQVLVDKIPSLQTVSIYFSNNV